jgi:hypothetical protein
MAETRRLVRRGDKTTTGGVVLEGCGHVILDYMDVANRGMTASCGACGQVGVIQDSFPHDLETEFGSTAVEGDEVLCSCPKGSNRVIAASSAPAIVGRGNPLSFHFSSGLTTEVPKACIFAKSCTVPLTSIEAGSGAEPVANFGRVVVLAPMPAEAEQGDEVDQFNAMLASTPPAAGAQSATATVALGRLSGSVPSELGAWALRTSGAASGAFLMAFWPSDMGDGALYTDAQLQGMSRAATRARFRFGEDEQGRMQVYGIHTSAASGMESVPVVQARQEGSALVASVPGGPTLTWYPDGRGSVPDASSYYPDRDGLAVSSILVRPIPEAPDAELETFPASGDELEDCIITFPASLGIPPLYLVFSKPPVKLLEVDTYRGFQGRPREGTHADHMPSAAAVEANLRNSGLKLSEKDIASMKKDVAALIVPASVHQKCSETYGGRNTPAQIDRDAKDLKSAVDRNLDAIKGCLQEEGFNDAQIEQARQEMHRVNRAMGVYE